MSDKSRIYSKFNSMVIFSLVVLVLAILGLYFTKIYEEAMEPEFGSFLTILFESLFIAYISILTFEWLVKEKANNELEVNIDKAIGSSLPQAILTALESGKKGLTQLFQMAKNNEIILAFLSYKLDPVVAKELYYGVIDPTLKRFEFGSEVVLNDYASTIDLEPCPIRQYKNKYYSIIIDETFKYRLNSTQLKFACVNNESEFEDLIRDPTFRYVYILMGEDMSGIEFDIREVHLRFGRDKISPTKEVDTNQSRKIVTFTDPLLGKYMSQECELRYKIVTLIDKKKHLYYYKVHSPIKDCRSTFNTGKTDISDVSINNLLISLQNVKREDLKSIEKDGTISKRIEIGGWVFGGGVSYVWHY